MISCFAQNQTQALQMSVFIILPSVLLSGFVFPLESMPAGFRYLGECFPITYYINISRQIILKGGGLAYVWQDTLALAAYIAVMFTASVVMVQDAASCRKRVKGMIKNAEDENFYIRARRADARLRALRGR